MPQPTAEPFTAAISGLPSSIAAIAAGVGSKRTRTGAAARSAAPPTMISRTSSPEQKAGSAPVTTMQRTSGSAWSSRR